MHLREFLPPSVSYMGFDRFPAVPGVNEIDLDARRFPPGSWDYVVLLGVLSWISEKQWTLDQARKHSIRLILTRKNAEYDQYVEAAGWRLERALPFKANTGIIEVALYV